MKKITLYYLPGRGRAESIRILLTFLGLDFEERPITTPEAFQELVKKYNPFKQLPILTIDDKPYVQTPAIIRYLARENNLYGNNAEEYYQCDVLASGFADWQQHYFNMSFDKEKNQIYFDTDLPKYLSIYEDILSKNQRSYFVNQEIQFPDLLIFEMLLNQEDFFKQDVLKNYPALKNFVLKIKSIPAIEVYLNSPKRYALPSDANQYMALIRYVFNRK